MADGVAEIGFARHGGATRLVHLYQADPLRVLFPIPDAGDPILAAIVTTSGGLVAGDHINIAVRVDRAASAHVTASAAEKIYRSPSTGNGAATTAIQQSLTVGCGGTLEFLPPETILFDGARLVRETLVELAPGASFLGGGIVVFGRRARGERFTHGLLREGWEVRRAGALVWGDALQLDGDVARIIDDPACFGGAAGFATMILDPAGRDPQKFVDGARGVQAGAPHGVTAGVTAIAGLAIARWLAADAALLRQAYADLACHWRAEALGLPRQLPRIWHV